MMDGGEIGSPPSAAAVRINLCGGGKDPTVEIHHLPCCIKYDGPSDVSHYFKPKHTGMEVDGLKMEEAYFRGRKLQGTTFPLPHGYSGFVIGKKSVGKTNGSVKADQTSNSWETKAKFESLTLWNHDSLPSQDDTFLRSFHWLTVANALHQPVTAEELQAVSITKQPQD